MTPFGKMLRQERKELGLSLGDLSNKLGISVPYLSQIETGSKPLQDGFVDKVVRVLDFKATEANKLRRAAAASMSEFTLRLKGGASHDDRVLASALANGFARMSPEKKAQLRELMGDESNG